MPNPLEAVREFFRPAGITFAQPDSVFVKIDRLALAEKLGIDEQAESAGKQELPSTDTQSSDFVEAEIKAEITEQLDRAQINYSNNVRVYDQRLGQLALLGRLSTITGAIESAFGDFKAVVKVSHNRMTNDEDAIRESYQELTEFKRDHGLRRPARQPDPSIYTYSAFGLSWALESAINSQLLRVNDKMGIAGGLFAAGAIAFINIGFGALVGRKIWPEILHKDLPRKLLGWIIGIAWLILTAGWNLAAAHFRDAKVAGSSSPETEALVTLMAAPFELSGMNSYGLFGLGFVLAIVAAAAGFRMDDPYPGYGPIYRRHIDRCNKYGAATAEAIEELTEIRDQAVEALQSVENELRVQAGEYSQIANAQQSLYIRFKQHQDYLDNIETTLIQRYRSINRQFRTTPAPHYFDEKWIMQRTEPEPPSQLPAIDAAVSSALQSLHSAIAGISQSYQTAIDSFVPLQTIKSSLEHE